MRYLRFLLPCLVLAAPSSALAYGASLTAGAGLFKAGDMQLKVAFEASLFHEISIIRLEPIVVEMALKPARSFAWRPGIKVFVPITGLYLRGGYGLGNLGGEGSLTHSVILGVGWQKSLLDTVGIFFEGTGEPQLKPSGTFVALVRAGLMINI